MIFTYRKFKHYQDAFQHLYQLLFCLSMSWISQNRPATNEHFPYPPKLVIKLLRMMSAFKRFMANQGAVVDIFKSYKHGNVSGHQIHVMISKSTKDQMGLLGTEKN